MVVDAPLQWHVVPHPAVPLTQEDGVCSLHYSFSACAEHTSAVRYQAIHAVFDLTALYTFLKTGTVMGQLCKSSSIKSVELQRWETGLESELVHDFYFY